MTAPKWLKDYGLEPDFGRLIIAQCCQLKENNKQEYGVNS